MIDPTCPKLTRMRYERYARYMDIDTLKTILKYGTSEGAKRGWDTRGRGTHEKPKSGKSTSHFKSFDDARSYLKEKKGITLLRYQYPAWNRGIVGDAPVSDEIIDKVTSHVDRWCKPGDISAITLGAKLDGAYADYSPFDKSINYPGEANEEFIESRERDEETWRDALYKNHDKIMTRYDIDLPLDMPMKVDKSINGTILHELGHAVTMPRYTDIAKMFTIPDYKQLLKLSGLSYSKYMQYALSDDIETVHFALVEPLAEAFVAYATNSPRRKYIPEKLIEFFKERDTNGPS